MMIIIIRVLEAMEALQSRIDAELEAASFVHLHHFLDEASCDALMREVPLPFNGPYYPAINILLYMIIYDS